MVLYLYLKKNRVTCLYFGGLLAIVNVGHKGKIVGSAEQLKNEIMLSIRFLGRPHENVSAH